uniref:Uncharacterized protein n=1 Tax=Lactuca sativa TaxID=4236 RepID=A0A9R1XU30_LACSA|nr:hypothetical protein LSAT_V11C100039090 [Lactuca sativa]
MGLFYISVCFLTSYVENVWWVIRLKLQKVKWVSIQVNIGNVDELVANKVITQVLTISFYLKWLKFELLFFIVLLIELKEKDPKSLKLSKKEISCKCLKWLWLQHIEEHLVKTSSGYVSVAIYGDQEKPVLITYPDLALNDMSCFQGLFLCPEAFSLLIHKLCIYHIIPPDHELGAAAMSYNDPLLAVDDLADQVAEVLEYFGKSHIVIEKNHM